MININATLLIQLLNFLLLVYILNRLLLQPILRQQSERRKHFEDLDARALGLVEETSRITTEYKSREKEARDRFEEERRGMRRDAQAKADEIFNAAQTQVGEIRARIASEIAAEIERVRPALFKQVETFAEEVIPKLLHGRVAH